MSSNCTTNCTNHADEKEEGMVGITISGGVITGLAVAGFFFLIISCSLCYAKKWCCFAVS